MTYKNIQDRVMARLNLTSAAARLRIKDEINERYRRAQSSVGLGKVRRGTVAINTVAGTADMVTTGLIKVITVFIPTLNRVLEERTMDYLRLIDPAATTSAGPWYYAVEKVNAASVTLRLFPTPDVVVSISIDGLLVGVDLVADADIPAFPEDFHDALVQGVMADEYDHMDKPDRSKEFDMKAESRMRECRYFISKSAWLARAQGSGSGDMPWWLLHAGLWVA